MKRQDFLAVIGYHGNLALVDKRMRSKMKNKSIEELAQLGEYKGAFCATFFEDITHRQLLLSRYNALCGSNYSLAEMERLFGVFHIPEKVKVQDI
ncbi:MAG: hypothetical protein ACRCVN_03575 [Spirochaetia bacterium]